MNIKRGLFRLWLVLSIAWIAFMGYDFYDRIKSPYIPLQEYRYVPETKKFIPHVDETDPMKWMDFTRTRDRVEFPINVIAYIPSELPGEDAHALRRRFHAEFVVPRETEVSTKRREYILELVHAAFWPPVAVFLIGAALVWAFSGFARAKVE
ncbi:hypothetical protein GHK33_10985 [Sinorhizobium meliloti]|uniref:hypothetical protein n=1 Tax=Rhizobium meliloti TaxID=382 RepID=UPI001295D292|nr:hypothetical protein [Sinorhizobium meliloti]MQW63171.1 hypothetical protein [Sinorhizobium meliloti]